MGDNAIYLQDFTRGLPGLGKMPSVASGSSYMFWIVGTAIMFVISYCMYTPMNRQVAGTLFFILSILLLYFYYVKWYLMANKKGPGDVSKCPDYLTHYVVPGAADGTSKAKSVCLDFVGVSSNGILKKCVKDPAACIADPSGDYVFTPPTTTNLADYRDMAAQYGLLWTSVLGDV
jgi:hypothetical protein